MRLTVTINCDTPAFGYDAQTRDEECASILSLLALKIDKGGHLCEVPLFDSDRSEVGVARFED